MPIDDFRGSFVTLSEINGSAMLRRLPPIVQFIFVSMIGICLATAAGLIHEFMQRPFSATNAIVWLFLLIVSGIIVTLIVLFGRNRLGK